MMNRRKALATAAAAATAAATISEANAAPSRETPVDGDHLTPGQEKMLNIRFDTLDGESHQDFVVGIKNFLGRRITDTESRKDIEARLRAKGLNSIDNTSLNYHQSFDALMEAPEFAAYMRLDATGQHIMWDRARRVFEQNADHYLDLLDDAETKGPGKLEMNPNLDYPDYASLEIHGQPGGYVGDPLGGWVYHYAVTKGYRQGTAFHDENHIRYAMSYQKPADGEVRRYLDLGCGTGQSTTPIKMRFPDAEVWGIEVGGPLVRYAHYRARKMGLDVNFRHGLAEDTKFPDNHFDMVSSSIMFHEVSRAAAAKIVAETFRVLRPGGTYSHSDTITEGHDSRTPARNISGKATIWRQYRHHTYEPWFIEYTDSDFPGMLRQAGFKVDLSGDGVGTRPRLIATKPA